jgi:hypothetical protein
LNFKAIFNPNFLIMKRVKFFMILLLSVGLTVSCSKDDSEELTAINAKSQQGMQQGNGAPSGAHYNLNIIGVGENFDPASDMTGNNGHRIFVKLGSTREMKRTKIWLTESTSGDFLVTDANGADGEASFEMPNPFGSTRYAVYVRPLGSGGSAEITLCADADLTEGYVEVCTTEPLEVERTKGSKPRFTNETDKLLTITITSDVTGYDENGVERTISAGTYNIFDPLFEDFFWYYDNNGLRILQLRFYEIS